MDGKKGKREVQNDRQSESPILKKQKSGNWEDASKSKHHDWAYLHIDSHHSLYIYAFIHSHTFVFMFISLSPSFQC